MNKKYNLLPQEEIISLYESGKSCYYIGKIFSCSYSTIRNILLKNKISMRDASLYNRTTRKTILNDIHRQIIDGLLLGDGCVRRHAVNATAELSVSTVEEEFANYLLVVLPLELYINSEKACKRVVCGKEANCKKSYKIHSRVDISLDEYREKWYPDGIKIVPSDLVLTPISVKYWFWGDGSTSYIKYKNNKNAYVNLHFYTNGFLYQNGQQIVDVVFHMVCCFLV